MSEVNKDNKDYEFIKEQVMPKKLKKFRRWFVPFLTTAAMAVVFGIVAAFTFCIAEPGIHKLLFKNEPNPFNITPSNKDETDEDEEPSDENPNDSDGDTDEKNGNDSDNQNPVNKPVPTVVPGDDNNGGQTDEPAVPVVVQPKEADIEDFISIYEDIKLLTKEIQKSILTVSGIVVSKDWFGNPIERNIYTSGIILEKNDTNILLLVSYDRVKDASGIKVELSDLTSVDAVIHDYESELNLAIISAKISNLPKRIVDNLEAARLGESYSIAVGNPVIAMGCPNGYPGSMDMGIVTSKGVMVSITDYELELFNTNMIFNKDSDGVLLNFKGEIIGLITRTINKDSSKELSTAIGISKIKSYIDNMLIQKPRIYTGIIAENMPQSALEGQTGPRGIYVYEVKKDSPAFNAGIMSGDIILYVNDRMISSMSNYYSAISSFEPGTEVVYKIRRTSGTTDKEMELKVVLEAKK